MIAAMGGATAVFGAGFASASSLGNVDANSLGTSATVVAACDPDGIVVTYNVATPGATPNPSYSGGTGTNSTWWLRAMQLTDVHAACNGKNYEIVLADSNGTSLATVGVGTLSLTGANSQVLTYPATNSRDVDQFVITIYG